MAGTCELSLYIHAVKGGAVLVSDDGDRDNSTWIPLSTVTNSRDELEENIGKPMEIEIQEWIAADRGFI